MRDTDKRITLINTVQPGAYCIVDLEFLSSGLSLSASCLFLGLVFVFGLQYVKGSVFCCGISWIERAQRNKPHPDMKPRRLRRVERCRDREIVLPLEVRSKGN